MSKQVIAFGNANYFRTKLPRIDVKEIKAEEKRDYVAAFDHFSREYEGIFGSRDPQGVLQDIRGG